jgi:hypothetical protein
MIPNSDRNDGINGPRLLSTYAKYPSIKYANHVARSRTNTAAPVASPIDTLTLPSAPAASSNYIALASPALRVMDGTTSQSSH